MRESKTDLIILNIKRLAQDDIKRIHIEDFYNIGRKAGTVRNDIIKQNLQFCVANEFLLPTDNRSIFSINFKALGIKVEENEK